MNEVEITPKLMLQDLLLNQMFFKREVCQIVQISMRLLNDILALEEGNYRLNESVINRISKLYERMKAFEDQIDDWLVKVPKKKGGGQEGGHSGI